MNSGSTAFHVRLLTAGGVFLLTTAVVAQDVNVIESIRTTQIAGAATVSVTLRSSREFPVRALPLVLVVGEREFAISLPSEDGSLHRVIFLLTPDEFDSTSTGDHVLVQYGHGEGSDTRDFGLLNKAQLNQ